MAKPSFKLATVSGPTAAFAVFAIVVVARASLVAARGADLPYLDSWEALLEHAMVPWSEGTLDIHELFRPHFEHPLVLTKLVAWLVTWLGGGTWHNVALLYVNAVVYAAGLAFIAWAVVPALPGALKGAFAVTLALLGSVPYGWANALWELQICWSLLVGLTAIAIHGALAQPTSGAARLGCAASVALPFTLAIGTLSVAVALTARMLSAWITLPEGPARWRAVAPWAASFALALGVSAVGGIERPPAAAMPTLASVVRGLTLLHSWPIEGSAAIALLAYVPWVLFTAWMLVRSEGGPAGWFVVTFGAWLLCVTAGLSVARSAELAVAVPHRYKELLALSAAMNIACLLCLAGKLGSATAGIGRLLRPVLLTWALAVGLIVAIVGFNPEPIASRWRYQQQMRENIRDYYATGNVAVLDRGDIVPFPYASPARFAALLDRAGTRRLLAPVVGGR